MILQGGVHTSIPKKTDSFVILQGGVHTSIPKKTYRFVILQGGVHTSIPKKTDSFVIFQVGSIPLFKKKPYLCDFPGLRVRTGVLKNLFLFFLG